MSDATPPATVTPAPRPGKSGQPWSADEDAALQAAFARGVTVLALVQSHERSLTAIEARLEKLGLLAPGQRVTRNRYPLPAAAES